MNRKIMGIGIVCLILATIGIVAAQNTPAPATTVDPNAIVDPNVVTVTPMCFKYDSFTDTWHLQVESVGNTKQISGIDPQENNAAIFGGGQMIKKILYLSFDERGPFYSPSGNGVHMTKIDTTKTPWTGIDFVTFFDFNGVKVVSFPAGLTFKKIACPPLEPTPIAGPLASKP